MTIFINPGSGPVADASRDVAASNMEVFADDLTALLGARPRVVERPQLDDEGRFGFLIVAGDSGCEVEMPGIPVERVRFIDSEGQNIWHFPRLYIDGSSWVWKYALGATVDVLTSEPDDD